MSAATELPPALIEAQYFIRITQIHFCCMYAVVLWDWIINIPREWRSIWSSPWSLVKVLYILSRYWVIAGIPVALWAFVTETHTEAGCAALFRVPVILCLWNQIWAEGILLTRTYAMLGQSKIVLGVLGSALLCVIVYQVFAGATQMLPLPFLTPPFTHGPCFPVAIPGSASILGFFIAPLLFDTLVTGMCVWRAVVISRRGGAGSPILKIFMREGVIYFLLISVANLVNGIFYLQPNASMSALNIPLSVMFPNILACRLVLDLRDQGQSGTQNSSSALSSFKGPRKTVPVNKVSFVDRGTGVAGTRPGPASTDHGAAIELSRLEAGQSRVEEVDDSDFDHQKQYHGAGSVAGIEIHVEKATEGDPYIYEEDSQSIGIQKGEF